jgi:SAM-dependent methyltransferase
MFASCLPGLGPLVRRQLDALPGLRTSATGFDGRADLVLFRAERGHRSGALSLRTTDDVFVETGRARRTGHDTAHQVAARLWPPQPAARALSIWAGHAGPLTGSMTFRVIVRVLSERSFLRTELRTQLGRAISADRPRWRHADPAQLEIWASEYQPDSFVAGLRLTDARMRQHEGREAERRGALRPALAAAMVSLAGRPTGLLLDPCCGSGTILAEAIAVGWAARGIDIDPAAVTAARTNVPAAAVERGDARATTIAAGSIAACVSNLPFGRQYQVPGDSSDWLSAVLTELGRLTAPGGGVVLLAPGDPGRPAPGSLRLTDSFPVSLLGTSTSVWCYQRR